VNESQKNESTPADAEDRFADFWAAYPRRVGKLAAQKAWARAIKSQTPEVIIATVRQTTWPQDVQYIPHPATWLNAGRWMDEAPPSHNQQVVKPSAAARVGTWDL
jgi:hypothetical protein